MGNGKLKRLLALLLCMTQLFGFTPHVHAETDTPGVYSELPPDDQTGDDPLNGDDPNGVDGQNVEGGDQNEPECTHPADQLTETDSNNRFQKNPGVTGVTETEHTRTFEVWGYFSCSCGETGLEHRIVADASETEEHYFVNGKCVTNGCDYPQPTAKIGRTTATARTMPSPMRSSIGTATPAVNIG